MRKAVRQSRAVHVGRPAPGEGPGAVLRVAGPPALLPGYGVLLIVAIFLVVFQAALTAVVPQLQFFDEMLLPAALMVIVTHVIGMRVPRLELLVLMLMFYMLLVSFVFGRSHSFADETIQVLIHLKFFLLFVLIRPLLHFTRELHRLEKVYLAVGAISLAGIVMSFLVPELFQSTIGGSGMSRFGLVRATGFQVKPNDVALFLAPMLIMLVARAAIRSSGVQLIGLFALALAIFLANTSRVAALVLPFSALLVLLVGRLPRLVNVIMVLVFLALLPLLFLSQFAHEIVDYTIRDLSQFTHIDQTEYIRAIMIYYSFVIAGDYFPIGSGAGTYGSTMSEGSPVYADLGLYGLASIDSFMGVFDSNFATLLGEFGVVGIALFIGLTIYVLRDIRQVLGVNGRQAVIYHRIVLAFLLLVALTNPMYMYSLTSVSILLAAIIGLRYFPAAGPGKPAPAVVPRVAAPRKFPRVRRAG